MSVPATSSNAACDPLLLLVVIVVVLLYEGDGTAGTQQSTGTDRRAGEERPSGVLVGSVFDRFREWMCFGRGLWFR